MINPYDHCVANKIIKGKQCMVLWHVDNLKIAHVDKYIVEGIRNEVRERKPSCDGPGKVLEYLGMMLDYRAKGKVKLSMFDYV